MVERLHELRVDLALVCTRRRSDFGRFHDAAFAFVPHAVPKLSFREDDPRGRGMCLGLPSHALRDWLRFPALRLAFASIYLADDVREHVFWMFRYMDPGLFPQDPIADYFQSLAPSGYASPTGCLAKVGIDPLLASKLFRRC